MVKRKATYGLEPGFERALVTALASSPSLYRRVGHGIDPDMLDQQPCVHAMRAIRAIATDTGRGPESSVLVAQRLRRWYQEGQITHEDVGAAVDVFDAAEDAGIPSEESIVQEVAPILRELLQRDAAHAAATAYQKKGEGAWQKVQSLVSKAERIGAQEESRGIDLGVGAFDEISRLRAVNHLPTGILELDAYLDGGPPRGTYNLVAAGPGGGKSLFLTQVMANALLLGQPTLFATLELSESIQMARLLANLTGIGINSLLDGQMDRGRAVLADLQLGFCRIRYFSPGVTPIEDIFAWVREVEAEIGVRVANLIVDYADELTSASASPNEPRHQMMTRVSQSAHIYAEARNMWVWSASQSNEFQDKRKKKIDCFDLSDTKGKSRKADLLITQSIGEGQGEVSFFIAKNRLNQARASIGPLPTDLPTGRIVARGRDYGDPAF